MPKTISKPKLKGTRKFDLRGSSTLVRADSRVCPATEQNMEKRKASLELRKQFPPRMTWCPGASSKEAALTRELTWEELGKRTLRSALKTISAWATLVSRGVPVTQLSTTRGRRGADIWIVRVSSRRGYDRPWLSFSELLTIIFYYVYYSFIGSKKKKEGGEISNRLYFNFRV